MATQKQNSKNAHRSTKTSRTAHSDRRWTLLFIGDHGRVIPITRFKGLVVFILFVVCVTSAIATGLYFLNQNIINDKKRLETMLAEQKEQIEALRQEKEILMARLVLTESRVQSSIGSQSEIQNEKELQDEEKDLAENQPQAGSSDQKSVSGLSVAIENFNISEVSENDSLSVQFKIKNTSPNSQRVSGHSVVVLKGNQIEPTEYVAIPRMPLPEGKPTGRQRGYAFGIRNFKTMRFTAATPKFAEKYHTAAVYVFTREGELLLEQDFAVDLQ